MSQTLTETQWKEIDVHISAGRMIQAIKLYRELTNAGLADAKGVIEARAACLEAGQAPSDDLPGEPAQSDVADIAPDQWKEIDEHLFAGRKLHAIKLYRDWTECDLVDSKRMIEARDTDLRRRYPLRFTEQKSGCLGSILLVLALMMPIIYILLTRVR